VRFQHFNDGLIKVVPFWMAVMEQATMLRLEFPQKRVRVSIRAFSFLCAVVSHLRGILIYFLHLVVHSILLLLDLRDLVLSLGLG